MDWLNYHHLHYFWVVAREGSIVAASKKLRLAHPTISAQIKQLEDMLGAPLFERRGRRLVLTETGSVTLRYADSIFSLGNELLDTVRGRVTTAPLRLRVGLLDMVPKSVAHRLLEPAFATGPLHLVVREGRSLDEFLAEMATHDLDLLISDRPAGPGLSVTLFNHLLGSAGTEFVASAALAERVRSDFPRSLDRAPAILPSAGSAIRRSLDAWFEAHDLRPMVVAEVDDSALAKVLAAAGIGVCAVPSIVTDEVRERYKLYACGRAAIRQDYFAISAERRVVHPGVIAIRNAARDRVFAEEASRKGGPAAASDRV